MFFVDLPKELPHIDLEKVRYNLDEPIYANCTSALSYPAANITWFVNGMQVSIFVESFLLVIPSIFDYLSQIIRFPRI
jgi:hypothetical protein